MRSSFSLTTASVVLLAACGARSNPQWNGQATNDGGAFVQQLGDVIVGAGVSTCAPE